MKKITLLFFTFLAVTFGFSQNGGDDCGSAVIVTPGSFTATTITAASAGGEMGGGGNDSAWFSYTPAASGTINVFSCLGGSDTRLWIGTGTCGALTSIADNDDACEMTAGGNAYASALYGVVVTAGTTYYIEWDDRWAEGPFDWTLEFQACVAPTATAAVVDDCGNSQFSIDVDVTDMGSATTVTLSNDYDANTVNITGVGIWTAGPFPLDANVVITLEHDADTACDIFSGILTDTCPPDNDDCSGAETLTPGATFDVNPLVGTTGGATASEVADPSIPATTCANYNGGDVWYAVTVPADGNLTIETNANPTGNGGDGGMTVYTGTCGALVEFDCDDDGSPDGLYSQVDIVAADGLANQTVYVRVWEYGNDAILNFQVSAHSATLSTNSFDVNGFEYFPNPVNDKLSLRAQNNIQNVSVYNILGQEVVRMAPNAISSDVDMTELNNGAYFVKVTINDKIETIKIIKK